MAVGDGTRGTATILFTDLVGSTALRSRLGEAAADDLRRRHDGALTAVVDQFGGEVVKAIGDGIMATFASAADAVEAGVGAQVAVDRLGREIGTEVQIRVGISSGDVSWEDGDCFGLPVVEAARLEGAAEPGQILCSAIVQMLAGGRAEVAFEAVGDLELKGLDGPVAAFSVPWEPARDGDPRSAGPFAGRVEALATFDRLLEQVVRGVGTTLLVAGEPGAGKTRLVIEALKGNRRADVVWGHSYGGEVIPLGPVMEILDALAGSDARRLRRCAAHHDRVIAELSPVAAAAWPDVVVPDRLDLVESRQRLHSAVSDTLAGWAAETPLVVVFDDLHWADELSVSVLRAVARRAMTSPLLVVGTYRSTDLDRRHAWGGVLAEVVREVEPAQLALAGLTTDEVGDLVAELAGDVLDEDLVDGLASASGGNPLFVLEIARQLAESGAFSRGEDGVWRRVEEVPLELPQGLRQVIGGRVSRLDETTQAFLAVAAMFESPFELGLVAALAGVSDDEAVACLEAAQAADLVEATSEFDVYVFAHAMVRQTLYEEANLSRVVRLHRRIAEAMEARLVGEATGVQAAALAHHYASSAVMPGAEAGVRWAVAAAMAAREGGAFADAVRNITIAEELIDDPTGLPTDLVVAKAEAFAAMADVEQARAACSAAAAVLDEAAAARLYADSARSLEAAGANVPEVWDFAEVGLEWCGDRRDESWLVLRNYQVLGEELRDSGYLGIPRDSRAKQELGEVSIRLGSAQHVRAIYRDREQILSHPRPNGIALALHAGEFLRSLEPLSEHVAHTQRNGLPGEELVYRGILARVFHSLGQIERQQEVLAQGWDLYRRTPWANAVVQFEAGAAVPASVFEGSAPDSHMRIVGAEYRTLSNRQWLDALQTTLSESTDASLLFVKSTLLVVCARQRALFGERAEALSLLEAGLPALTEGPAGATNYPMLPSVFIEALIAMDELRWLDEARIAAMKVIDADFHYPEYDARMSLGQLEARLGNRDESLRWFGESRRARIAQGASPHIALVNLNEAEAELRFGGSPARIRELLDSARPELERIGADARVADCDRIEAAL